MRPSITHHSPQIKVVENHTRILSGNISFGVDNLDQSKNVLGFHAIGIVTPVAPNTDFAVPYVLPFLPTRYWIVSISANANIYTGVTPWTSTEIFLRCSVASVTLSLFID